MRSDIQNAPWHICSVFDDVDDVTWAWETIYKDIINDHIKTRQAKVRKSSLPWMNSVIRKAMNWRYKLLLKGQKTPKGSVEWQNYKKERNRCTKLLRHAETNYWKNKFDNADTGKDFWKVVKEFEGGNQKTCIGPIKDDEGILLTDNVDKCNQLNNFFVNIGKVEKIPENAFLMSHLYRVTPSVSDLLVDEKVLCEKFSKKIKIGRAGGNDDISARDLKLAGSGVLIGLKHIFKSSFECRKFPTQFKEAKKKCIFKKGSKVLSENYRPISLLSLTSKLLESQACNLIDNHLLNQNLSNDHQWGFRKGRSPELHLLNATEKWKDEMNNGKTVGVIFLDFSKAFDSVCHKTLQSKLIASGISGDLFQWLTDYMMNRTQYVQIDNQRSKTLAVEQGVPQGSLLGPRLYNIYANDLPLATTVADVEMFADDTIAYCSSTCFPDLINNLQLTIKELHFWATLNGMVIHPGKSKIMLMSKKSFIGPIPKISMGDKGIEIVNEAECLGITLDSKLSFSQHIQKSSRLYNLKLKKLKRMKRLSYKVLETFYFKAILPSVLYAISVWGNCSSSKFKSLESIHAHAAKIIYDLPNHVNEHESIVHANWKPLSFYYKRRILCLVQQIYYEKGEECIAERFQKVNKSYALRNKIQFKVPTLSKESERRTFHYQGARLWNAIQDCLKEIESYDLFKSNINKHSNMINQFSFAKEIISTVQVR